jgi:hypothetical protein
LFELYILATIRFDADVLEGLDDSLDIEAHIYKSIDEVLVIPLVPAIVDRLRCRGGDCASLRVLELGVGRSIGMEYGPLMGLLVKGLWLVDHHLRNLGILGVLGLRALEKRLEGQQGRLDGEDRRPGSAEGIETDGALFPTC